MKNKLKNIGATLLVLGLSCGLAGAQSRWSEEKATAWGKNHRWLVGCNFSPSTAINQLEMWQADTFDPETIDRELGYAEGIGFSQMFSGAHLFCVFDFFEYFVCFAVKHFPTQNLFSGSIIR